MNKTKESEDKKTISVIHAQEEVIQTPIDRLMDIIISKKKASFSDFLGQDNWTPETLEQAARLLERQGVISIHYPDLLSKNPFIQLEQKVPVTVETPQQGEVLAEYAFKVDQVPVHVTIARMEKEYRPRYLLGSPKLGPYTRLFLDELKEVIAEKTPIESTDMGDAKGLESLKQDFFRMAQQEIQQFLPGADEKTVSVLSGLILHALYGIGKLELLTGDEFLEEITVNASTSPIMVYHQKRGWLKTNLKMDSEEQTYTYASQIARKVGRDITTLNPILDAHLLSGDRVNATLEPITSNGNTITIRRFARNPWTVIDFIGESHTMNSEMAALLWLAMQYEMNILISGGTASGKTSVLNSLTAFLPDYHRVLSIEDVRELLLPEHLHDNWIPMTTRNANPEGQGRVTMLELMQSSLRMRPDRIILGEIRRHKEAETLFEAMHTGHAVYSTLHANSAQQVLQRLTKPPISIPPLEVEAIDLVVVQFRDRKSNKRRTYEISEIEAGVNDDQLNINTIYQWSPRTDDFEKIKTPSKFFRNLNLHTGMTTDEINKELSDRALILEWMKKKGIKKINEVGAIMNAFYFEPQRVKEVAKKNGEPAELAGGQ